MPRAQQRDTRELLLRAAVDLVAASPGDDFSLRAVCDKASTTLPTLYHFFGSKQGLIEAVADHGFDHYLASKDAAESTGDPLQDLRLGWNAHVDFGLANPGLYAYMYGRVRPGYTMPGQVRVSDRLRSLAGRLDDRGLLAVPVRQAAAHILVTNIGVTLRQIIVGSDADLTAAVREATIVAITDQS